LDGREFFAPQELRQKGTTMKKNICILCILAMIACLCPEFAEAAAFEPYVELIGDMNVRDIPKLTGELLAVAKTGEKLAFMEEASMDERGVIWYRVERKGVEGWVSSKYSVLTDGEIKGLGYAVENIDAEMMIAAETTLNAMPNMDAEAIASLQAETVITLMNYNVTDANGTWLYIACEAGNGWVPENAVTEIVEVETAEAAAAE